MCFFDCVAVLSYVFFVTTKSRVKRLYSTLHNHKLQEPSHIAVRNTDTSKNLYVYLADLDVQKCRQIKTKVIIAISKINNNILHSLTIFNQAVYSFIYCCKFFQNDIFRTVTSTGFSNNIWYNPVLWKFVEEEVAGQDIMSNLIKSTVLH